MEKEFVAKRVLNKLQATEKSIDSAMTEAAELLTTLIEARRELNISTVVGDKELANLTQALAALDNARHSTVALHNGLGRIAKAINITRMDIVLPTGPKSGAEEEENRPTMRAAS